MPKKLSTTQANKLVAILTICALLEEGLENYLGEDLMEELEGADMLDQLSESKLKLIRDLAKTNGLTKKDLTNGAKHSNRLADYIAIVE